MTFADETFIYRNIKITIKMAQVSKFFTVKSFDYLRRYIKFLKKKTHKKIIALLSV